MEISTNVPETDIVITPTVNWVQEYRISDGKLYFNTETNSQSPRTGSIVLSMTISTSVRSRLPLISRKHILNMRMRNLSVIQPYMVMLSVELLTMYMLKEPS